MSASLHFADALLPGGWARDVRITMRDGLIASIDVGVAAGPEDERHAFALPGLPNLHSHAFQRGMAGLAERRGPGSDSFWTWREVMYRFVDRIGPDELGAIAALAYMEMLETGFTRVGEFHYLHHDRDGRAYAEPAEMARAIAGAASETGIALTLLPVFYAHAGFGGIEPGHGQRRFISSIESFGRLLAGCGSALGALPDAVLGMAPHSLRAVTPAELQALLGLMPEGPVHIHVAEQVREVEECVAWSGARPVEWLLDNMPVDERWCLVHATHMLPEETVRLAACGAVAGLCPITEANLGDGLFPAGDFIRAGGHFGVGSDSNVLIDASEELRLLEYGQRLLHRGRNLLADEARPSTGEALFTMALAGGNRALAGAPGLVPGAPADIVSLDTDHPAMIARDPGARLDSWVFAAGRGAVDCVWRHGEKQVSGGRHRARPAIVDRYRKAVRGLLP